MSLQNAKALKAKKEEGNKAFKEGNFEAAYELYSEALTIDPNNIKTNAKLYCNRATVGSKVRNVHRRDPTGYVNIWQSWLIISWLQAYIDMITYQVTTHNSFSYI